MTSTRRRWLQRADAETRYPDALSDVIPTEYFTPEDGEAAVGHAEAAVAAVWAALDSTH